MWLTRLALRNPVLILMMSLMSLVLGFVSLQRLSVDLFPEINLPLVRIAAFYDAGMVYRDSFSFKPTTYRDGSSTGSFNDNVGFGIRLNLPIGPLRLDYGIPVTKDKFSGSSGRFQFGVGYTRDF